MALNKINGVSNETLTNIKKKSVLTIGNNPSEKGLSPQKIKEAMTKPIFDNNDSVIALFKRIINEMNAVIDSLNEKLSSIDSEDVELLNKINANATNINANSSSISAFTSELNTFKGNLSTINGTLNTLGGKVTNNENAINDMDSGLGDAFNRIVSLEQEIGTLVIGADFVPKTRTIAEISLENDITKQELVEAIISLFGSAAQVNTGYTANTIPVIGNDGKLPKNIIPINDGLIYGGAIESVGDYEALIYPSDAFIVKYPDTPTDDTITINRETTDYSDVYFVVQGASSEGDTILGIEGVQNGDWIIANAERGFLKIDNVDAVKSVNGMLGNVLIKLKDLILENYATSELDDNNIYPTDSAQTGISKLDKRTKELEAKQTEELPNVVLEIKNLDAPTASEQAIIIQKIKELTNNFTTSLDTTKFNEIVLKNDKTTVTTTEGGLKSVEGATVIVGSGWSCSRTYGRFDNLYYNVTDYAGYNYQDVSQLYIGYKGSFDDVFGLPAQDSIVFGSSGQIITPTNTFTMTNISGSDASNPLLLQWLQNINAEIINGVYEEGETITTPDVRQYSLVSYEHKVSDPTYYKFTFNLDNNTEYEIIIGADETVGVIKTEFARKSEIPTKTSELTNDSGYLTEESDPTVPAWAKATNKPSYSYSEITGKPTIPTVYNSTITIQKNGSSVGTFTLNASSGKVVNIIVPTKLNELSNSESKFVSETYLSGVLADYASKEDLESIEIPQVENKVTEEVTITSNTWVEDTNVSPFSYIATISLTNLNANSTSIELLNNNAILFATFGFAIGSVSESSVIIYAMDKPTEDVTLTFEVVNPVASDEKTLGFNFTTGYNFLGCDITVYDGTDASGTVLYSGTIEDDNPSAINSVVIDIPNGDFYLVLSTDFYFDGGGFFTATNIDNFTADPINPAYDRAITMSGKVTGAAIISGSISMDS